MNKKSFRSQEWRISEMAAHLPQEQINRVEPAGDGTVLSAGRIQQLALEKRSEYMKEKGKKPVRKIALRVLLAAALILATSITVFAATGGLEYIRSIFGDSALSIQNAVITPQASASANGREMAVEAVVTDGYITNMVVSITGSVAESVDLFQVSGVEAVRSVGWQRMEEFSNKDKTYFTVVLASDHRFQSAGITLSLKEEIAPIQLSFPVSNQLGNAVVRFPEEAVVNGVELRELQVSPMGFLLIGREDDAKGGLPSTSIRLVFADGETEELEAEFSPSDEIVSGGGGAVMADHPRDLPLVVTFHGTRNPEGELVVNGQFSRIIDPESIQMVIIEGVEYPVR